MSRAEVITPRCGFIYKLARWVVRLIFRYVRGGTVEGADTFPLVGSVIIAPNHPSVLDPPFIHVCVPRAHVWSMAKAELFKGWLGSWLMPRLNTYPVHRGRVDRQTIAQTLSILKEGGVLLLFPEGTTAQDGEIHDAKGGMAVFAFKTDSPVVPTYISGTGAKKQRTRLRVQFGKPLYPKDFRHPDLSPNAQQDIFTEAVMTAIQQMANR